MYKNDWLSIKLMTYFNNFTKTPSYIYKGKFLSNFQIAIKVGLTPNRRRRRLLSKHSTTQDGGRKHI